jgi:hypothetical protein
MPKRIALTDYIALDGVSFSDGQVRSVDFTSEDAQVDASGFNSTGNDETLAGTRARSVTLEVFIKRDAGETFQVLYPLHKNKSTFDFVWRANQNASVSATNPELRGSVILPTWTAGATRGEVEVATLTFISQGSNPLEFHAT